MSTMSAARPGPVVRNGVLVLPVEPDAEGEGSSDASVIAKLEAFAAAYLDEVRRVLLVHGKTPPAWGDGLERFNALLRSRGLPQMALGKVDEASKSARIAQRVLREAADEPPRRRAIKAALEIARDAQTFRLGEVQAFNAGAPDALFAVTPVIDPELCSGCDACLRVCPSGVLTRIKDDNCVEYYHCTPDSCDACGLCGDVCTHSAIRLKTMNRSPRDIRLRSWVCSACGVEVHAPETGGQASDLCAICAQTGHFKKLHQVL